ncbi:MAG TPA: hypothetical protein VGB36_05370 [Gammaproteobacteria bacterium]
MQAIKKLAIAVGVVFFTLSAGAGPLGNITGIPSDLDELELYSSPGAASPESVVTAKDVGFPLPILEVSKNGMYKLQIKGAEHWVISDDVLTDRERSVDAGCEPKLAGTVVAHGKRGVGEGCQ